MPISYEVIRTKGLASKNKIFTNGKTRERNENLPEIVWDSLRTWSPLQSPHSPKDSIQTETSVSGSKSFPYGKMGRKYETLPKINRDLILRTFATNSRLLRVKTFICKNFNIFAENALYMGWFKRKDLSVEPKVRSLMKRPKNLKFVLDDWERTFLNFLKSIPDCSIFLKTFTSRELFTLADELQFI